MSGGSKGAVLCRLEDIEDGQAKGFTLGRGAEQRDILVARRGDAVFGYLNVCPHQGSPLDWVPDRFVCARTGLLLCATHGARFRIEDGVCVAGPCPGARLQPVSVARDSENRIVLAEPA